MFVDFRSIFVAIVCDRLREIFLKTENFIRGHFFAEVLKEVFQRLEESGCQFAELRFSVYREDANEWSKLAVWVKPHNVHSDNMQCVGSAVEALQWYSRTEQNVH